MGVNLFNQCFQSACLLIISISIVILIFKSNKYWQKNKEKPRIIARDADILISIVNNVIQNEFLMKIKLEYELKKLNMIVEFEKELKKLTVSVISSFSEPFLEELGYYFSKEYIIKYVGKQMEVFLIEFTNNKKIKTK